MAKILVVEPDDHVAGLFVDYFKPLGHTVVVVKSAEYALRTLQEHAEVGQLVDFMITANQLPDIEGVDLIPMAKEKFPKLHILFVSRSWGYRPVPKGADRLYQKPFDIEEINVAIKSMTT